MFNNNNEYEIRKRCITLALLSLLLLQCRKEIWPQFQSMFFP